MKNPATASLNQPETVGHRQGIGLPVHDSGSADGGMAAGSWPGKSVDPEPTKEKEMGEVAKVEPQQVAPLDQAAPVLDMIARAASDPNMDVEKLERLMAMHERVTSQRAETEFNDAMSAAQAEMSRVATDANNPQTRSRYASYAALDRALRPIYTKHGFALSFDTGEGAPDGWVRMICHASHRGGFTRTYHADMPADGKGAKGGDVMTKTHATGSAFTYGQRYLLKMIFNVAVGQDDDGNGADKATITDEQKQKIIALIKDVGADTKAFCGYLGVEAVDQIPATKFDHALKALEAKRARSVKK